MVLSEFQEQIQRLTNAFGARAFPQEKVDLLWSKCKYQTSDNFKIAVDWLILNKRVAPTGEDFLEAKEKSKSAGYFQPKVDCKDCSNSGWILSDGYAKRCECMGGAKALIGQLRSKSDGIAHKQANKIENMVNAGIY